MWLESTRPILRWYTYHVDRSNHRLINLDNFSQFMLLSSPSGNAIFLDATLVLNPKRSLPEFQTRNNLVSVVGYVMDTLLVISISGENPSNSKNQP